MFKIYSWQLGIMSIQITGNIVVLMRTLLILLRKLKCVIFQWWEGPHFLKNIVEYNNRSRKEMKIQIGDSLFNSCNERIVKTNSHLVTGEKKKNVQNIIDVKNFTTLKKLLIIASWVLRFICNVKSRICGNISNLKNHLTSGEINNSKNLWFQISHEKLINSHKFESLKKFITIKARRNRTLSMYCESFTN